MLLIAIVPMLVVGPGGTDGAMIVGMATYYADGVMDQVIANRVAWGQIDPATLGRYVGFVALKDCGRIGHEADILWPDGMEGPFLVVDCADPRDWPYLEKIDFAVDVGYRTARRHEMRGPVPVTVFVRG